MQHGQLMSHVDTDLVTREQLAVIPAPEPTATWRPIPHIELVETLERVLRVNQIAIREERFALRRDGSTLFGVLQLAYEDTPDGTAAMGLRTSNDKTMFDLSNSSRSFSMTLTPVNGSQAGPFSGPLAFNGQLYSRCFTPNLGLQNWTQIVTSDNNCAMRANFSYGGVGYSLVMSPQVAGTGTATVTCTSNSSPCSSWSDVPTTGPNASNPNVANLYGSGGALVGQYYLSFNISLTHP